MNFSWAVQQLREGKKVRRKVWDSPGRIDYVEINKDTKGLVTNHGGYRIFFLTDYNATDWELFEKPKETLSDKVIEKTPYDAPYEYIHAHYNEKDILEFIKKLEKEFCDGCLQSTDEIRKKLYELAGERFNRK